jgi:aspartate carbamoyltransferase catalytic subunit
MKDLISIDQLSTSEINEIHKSAETFFKKSHHIRHPWPAKAEDLVSKNSNLQDPRTASRFKDDQDFSLEGKILVNFFFENSTRTRTSFEIAAKRLGAEVVNIDISLSSLKKGESIIDTAKTINAMNPDFVAIRHNGSGIVALLKKYISASLINAGDGTNEHPSQALLDSFVIKHHKKDLQNLKIAICGDVLHSRVARSNIKLLKKFGAEINVITPPTLITRDYKNWLQENWNVKVFESLAEGIHGVDVIMMLRIQQERMLGCYIPSLAEYFKLFGLTHEKLKLAPNALVLHPGPINREVEISSALADDEKFSLILEQVEAGVAVRQALLKFLSK